MRLFVQALFFSFWAGSTTLAATNTIRVGSLNEPASGLIEIAAAEGLFSKEKLKVEIERFDLGKDALQALLDKRINFTQVYSTPLILTALESKSVKILSTLHHGVNNTALVTTRSSQIENPKDIEGKRIGFTFGTAAEGFLYLFIDRFGLTPNFVPVDLKPWELLEALESAKVDAVVAWQPYILYIEKKLPDATRSFFVDIYTEYSLLTAGSEWFEKNADKTSAFIRALLAANALYRSNPAKYQKLICSRLSMEAEVCLRLWEKQGDVQLELGLSNILLAMFDAKWRLLRRRHPTPKVDVDFRDLFEPQVLSKLCPRCVTFF